MNLLDSDDLIIGFRPERFLPSSLVAPSGSTDEIASKMRTQHLLLADVGKRVPLRVRVEYLEYLSADGILYGSSDAGRFSGHTVPSPLRSVLPGKYVPNSDL